MERKHLKSRFLGRERPDTLLTTWHTEVHAPTTRVLPDGCRDLIVQLDPDGSWDAFVTGLDAQAYAFEVKLGTRFVGVRLAPAAHAEWERSAAADVPLPRPVLGALDAVAVALETCLETAEARLARIATQVVRPGDPLVRRLLATLACGETPALVGISARSLRRRVAMATGAPPRFWAGLERAQRAAFAVASTCTPLVELAQEAGFADQAHMSRELKRWYGMTPRQLRADLAFAREVQGIGAFGPTRDRTP